MLDVQAVLTRCYDAARYDLDIDYTRMPPVALPPSDMAWIEDYLSEKGVR